MNCGKNLNLDNVLIEHFDCVDSTNEYLKNKAVSLNHKYEIAISDFQSHGKGSKGRTFFSPQKTGLYFSIKINEPKIEDYFFITPLAAVCTAKSIEKIFGISTAIKWVNDIFVNDKKVCGILTECVFEAQKIKKIIVGIGVNVFKPNDDFPANIKQTAGYLCDSYDENKKTELFYEIAKAFIDKFEKFDLTDTISQYRKRLLYKDMKIKVKSASREYDAILKDVDDRFALIVQTEKGAALLNSGEISIKKEDENVQI